MITSLKIDRYTWNTGKRLGGPRLLTKTGEREQLCCLGFLGRACGVADDSLINRMYPGGEKQWPQQLFTRFPVHDVWDDVRGKYELLAIMNDTEDLDHQTREDWIREAFKQWLSIDVEFVGDYDTAPTP